MHSVKLYTVLFRNIHGTGSGLGTPNWSTVLIHLKTLPRITYHDITYTFPQEVRVGGAQQEAVGVARVMGMSRTLNFLKLNFPNS